VQGAATSTWWDGPYLHPKEFTTEEINAQLIDQLRGYDSSAELTCDAPGALQASAILLPAVRRYVLHQSAKRAAVCLTACLAQYYGRSAAHAAAFPAALITSLEVQPWQAHNYLQHLPTHLTLK